MCERGVARRETAVCAVFSKQSPPSFWQQSLISLGKDFPNSHERVKLMEYIPIRPLITNNIKLKQEKTVCPVFWLELQKWGQNTHFLKAASPPFIFTFSTSVSRLADTVHQHLCRHCYCVLPSPLRGSGRPLSCSIKWPFAGVVLSSHFRVAGAD